MAAGDEIDLAGYEAGLEGVKGSQSWFRGIVWEASCIWISKAVASILGKQWSEYWWGPHLRMAYGY